MAPFIDWPEPHDATLGIPPSRASRNVDNLVVRIDGEATVSINQVNDSSGQRRQGLTVVVRVGETQVSAGRDDKSRVATTSHIDHGCRCEVDSLPGSETVTKHSLNSNQGEIVIASPNGLSVSVTHNHRSRHDSSLAGYGDAFAASPMASAEAGTSTDGDTVRDGTDTAIGSDSPVAQSAAKGAAVDTAAPHSPTTSKAGAA